MNSFREHNEREALAIDHDLSSAVGLLFALAPHISSKSRVEKC